MHESLLRVGRKIATSPDRASSQVNFSHAADLSSLVFFRERDLELDCVGSLSVVLNPLIDLLFAEAKELRFRRQIIDSDFTVRQTHLRQ